MPRWWIVVVLFYPGSQRRDSFMMRMVVLAMTWGCDPRLRTIHLFEVTARLFSPESQLRDLVGNAGVHVVNEAGKPSPYTVTMSQHPA
jgi:hypothetical protein